MCGRARCTVRPETVQRVLGAPLSSWQDAGRYQPSYNVLPGFSLPVVYHRSPGGSKKAGGRKAEKSSTNTQARAGTRRAHQNQDGAGAYSRPSSARQQSGEETQLQSEDQACDVAAEGAEVAAEASRVVHVMKWGLVPSFSAKTERPDHFRMFNARSESIHEKASFRRLLPSRRCVLPMEGFYEWKKEASKKQPFYIHLKPEEADEERPIVAAGLFDMWCDAEGATLFTFAIITTAASPRFSWLHDRMPAILPTQQAVDAWLDPDTPPEAAQKLCQPYNGEDLVWHAVSPDMGRPSFQGPECIAPLPPPSAKNPQSSQLMSMFRKRQEQHGERATVDRRNSAVDDKRGSADLGKALPLAPCTSASRDPNTAASACAHDDVAARAVDSTGAELSGDRECPAGSAIPQQAGAPELVRDSPADGHAGEGTVGGTVGDTVDADEPVRGEGMENGRELTDSGDLREAEGGVVREQDLGCEDRTVGREGGSVGAVAGSEHGGPVGAVGRMRAKRKREEGSGQTTQEDPTVPSAALLMSCSASSSDNGGHDKESQEAAGVVHGIVMQAKTSAGAKVLLEYEESGLEEEGVPGLEELGGLDGSLPQEPKLLGSEGQASGRRALPKAPQKGRVKGLSKAKGAQKDAGRGKAALKEAKSQTTVLQFFSKAAK